MKLNKSNLIWGILLILAGGVFLAQNLGYLEWVSFNLWIYIFAGASLVFFAAYFINGIKEWGWLFPACIFAAVASVMALGEAGVEGGGLGTIVLVGVAIPFVVAFFLNMRQNWWALIPSWTLIVIGVIAFLADWVPGEIIGTLVLMAIALPFLVVYLWDRNAKWALIPAGVMGVTALFPLLGLIGDSDWVAALVMFILATPFFVVFFMNRKNWWALIPAGILTGIGLNVLVNTLFIENTIASAAAAALMLLTWAATFGGLWLTRGSNPTGWAKYPALALAGVALLAFALNQNIVVGLAILMIAGGALVLYFGLRGRRIG